jgi:hypothetical protein
MRVSPAPPEPSPARPSATVTTPQASGNTSAAPTAPAMVSSAGHWSSAARTTASPTVLATAAPNILPSPWYLGKALKRLAPSGLFSIRCHCPGDPSRKPRRISGLPQSRGGEGGMPAIPESPHSNLHSGATLFPRRTGFQLPAPSSQLPAPSSRLRALSSGLSPATSGS